MTPVDERGRITEAYRGKAGEAVTAHWRRLPDDADQPAFRLEPITPAP